MDQQRYIDKQKLLAALESLLAGPEEKVLRSKVEEELKAFFDLQELKETADNSSAGDKIHEMLRRMREKGL